MTVCESRISDPWTTMTCQWLEGEIKRLKAYSLLLRLRWHSPVVYTQSWSWSASRNKMPVAQSPMFHNLHHIRRLICSWSCREHDRSKEDVSLALPGWQQTLLVARSRDHDEHPLNAVSSHSRKRHILCWMIGRIILISNLVAGNPSWTWKTLSGNKCFILTFHS